MEKFMDDLLLNEDDDRFSLSNSLNLSSNIRLNAFGVRDTATIEEAEAQFAFRQTKNKQWLNQEELLKAESAEEADKGVFCKSFSHQLKVFAHPEANTACVSYMMSRLKMRDEDSEMMKMWSSWACYFCFIAALRAESIGCRRLMVVVEISA